MNKLDEKAIEAGFALLRLDSEEKRAKLAALGGPLKEEPARNQRVITTENTDLVSELTKQEIRLKRPITT